MKSNLGENVNWNLRDIFENDEAFFKAKDEVLSLLKKIECFQGKLCNSSNSLYECYRLYELALEMFDRVYAYGMLQYHLDMANQDSIRLYKEVENLRTEFAKSTAFITPEITYADEKLILHFLDENVNLRRYKRDILDTLEKKKHVLSKEAESILANYAEVFSSSETVFGVLTNAEFKFGNLVDEDGNEVELTDSNYTVYLKSKDINVRKQAFNLMYNKYKEFINTIAELYLSNVKTTAINARLRNYDSSLEEAVIKDDSTKKVYDALIEAIDKHMYSNHEFIKLKKKLLNMNEMHMYDLYVNPFETNDEHITFEEAKHEVLNALEILGDEYVEKLNTAFENNWIDVYPNANKRGGAYSLGVYGIHPFVLMNFVNSKRDVSTIAHELGHSMHSYYSNKYQHIIDSNYTIMVAEVASTVNELLLSNYQIEHEIDKQKKAALLYEVIEMIRATLFRQSMFAEFEKIVHEKIESREILSAEDLNSIYYNLNKKYFGDDICIDENIKYEWARIPHFYSDFYVYKYATGISAAIIIATKIIQKEPGFVEKYKHMLKQGCSLKSVDLLKLVEVDLENVATYENAIKFYNSKIEDLKNILSNI